MEKKAEIPALFTPYIRLIRKQVAPYLNIYLAILNEMEFRYKAESRETVCTIDVKELREKLEKESGKGLTTKKIFFILSALCCWCGLEKNKDFWVSGGGEAGRKYHFKANRKTLNSFAEILSKVEENSKAAQ